VDSPSYKTPLRRCAALRFRMNDGSVTCPTSAIKLSGTSI
jgi:hypothetical protein